MEAVRALVDLGAAVNRAMVGLCVYPALGPHFIFVVCADAYCKGDEGAVVV